MLLVCGESAWSQVVLTGRVRQPRFPGSEEYVPMSAVYAFAGLEGAGRQATAFRTWETAPAGWYRLSGSAGNYTLVFASPAHFMRPIVMTNLYTRPGDIIDRVVTPRADYAVFFEGAWDNKPAGAYYQTFEAKGKSLTHAGFRLAHDGVDGSGPKSQNLVVSIHRRGPGPPDTWPRVGPAVTIPDVDSGGPKNYVWSAGWNSGEVPLTPGEPYAVCLRAEAPGGGFQPFWRPAEGQPSGCYRIAPDQRGFVNRELWMSVGTDGDGLLIPYNKRVHKKFVSLTKFGRKWSQTYVAQGRSLASVILYAATSGVQPSLNRQRVALRLRRGGPDGPLVGIEKIAIGNGNYTGDASWGVFGCAFAPNEVPLEPGRTYAIEFESIENYETLHGFVNAKGQMSDDRPGFNPYRKDPRDTYERGTAWFNGTQAMDYDLDMQVVEYEFPAEGWANAVETTNVLTNGDMESGDFSGQDPSRGEPIGWKRFSIEDGTAHFYVTDGADPKNRIVRVTAAGGGADPVDGGYVQSVSGLNRLETYRLSGRVRSSWAVDDRHQCRVGYDPTGQVEDPRAETIVWSILPAVHGLFVAYESEPIRPAKDAISVWLRGTAAALPDAPFRADFDDFALRQVRTEVPDGR